MYRVVIVSGKGFDDQMTVQRAMMDLRKHDRDATVVVGSYAGEVTAGRLWRMLGGDVEEDLPQWKIHGSDAGKKRDAEVLSKSADICISLEHNGDMGYMAKRFKDQGVTIWRYDDRNQVIDALP